MTHVSEKWRVFAREMMVGDLMFRLGTVENGTARLGDVLGEYVDLVVRQIESAAADHNPTSVGIMLKALPDDEARLEWLAAIDICRYCGRMPSNNCQCESDE